MANELSLGKRRVGDLVDFNADTPEVKVTLENSERGIIVTVPWSTDDSPYASWFLQDSGMVHIPPRPKGPVAPKTLRFHDSHGSVLLIGCRPRGFHRNMLGPGNGTLSARAAIMDAQENIDFDNPHGLQSEISGLRAWLGVSSWSEMHNREKRPMEITLKSLDVPHINIGEYDGIRLSLRFGWRMQHENDGDQRVLSDVARCVSQSNDPKSWGDHLELHRAIRDLLVLSRWHNESCIEDYASRIDDPIRTLGGKTHGEQWRKVIVSNQEPQIAPKGYRAHLFEYSELGAEGLLQWISLRDEFSRALDPVISSIGLRDTTANTLLAHTGPGLEAMGYLLMLRDGLSSRQAAGATLKSRFERILSDLGDCLPFDGTTWVDTTSSTYNGIKHANRQEPDPVDVLNAWRESVLVARAWVAVELGIPLEQIKNRLSNDPQRHAYVKVE